MPGFERLRTVPPPSRFWRVSDWPSPLDPKPPARPLREHDPRNDDSGRWDDPRGVHRTLYVATEPEGAVGERLGEFALNVEAVVAIEAFVAEEPDPDFEEQLVGGLTADAIESFEWTLTSVPARPDARFIDVQASATFVAVATAVLRSLRALGVQRFDRSTLLDERRSVTRRIAGIFRDAAEDEVTGELRAAGLRYLSRLPAAWECWALWEPLPFDADEAETEDVTIDTPALRRAAALLGIPLLE